MSAILVLTTGQTDVQLVKGDARQELSKKNCASLHDEIERLTGEWRLVISPPSKAAAALESLPQGAFDLCAPKLDAVLRYAQDNKVELTSALILDTRRDAQAAPGDPRYAGAVSRPEFGNMGSSMYGRCHSSLVKSAWRAANLGISSFATRSWTGSRGRWEKLSRDFSPAQILVATTGGFPVVANLVEEMCRLYAAPDRTVELSKSRMAWKGMQFRVRES